MSMHKGMLGRDSNGPGSADLTLGDYIQRKVRQQAFDDVAQEEKITFDEWHKQHAMEFSRLDLYAESLIWQAWETALTRGKM